jgi:hypothetical protein
MSATVKIIIASGIGVFASWLIDGDYSLRSLARLGGNLILSAFAAIIFMFFVDSFGHAPEFVQWGGAGLIGGVTNEILRRMKRTDVTIKIGSVVELTSEGLPQNDA